ncbi:helix-turn-helix transcriptional regulator [Serratia oryzae]|uniref:helix-turn-helix transcriptional regulator n=1 Tax=Serratia oryzae TaxID=2034155 RepID=UPI0012E266B2|nr:AlpA family transcriptional regulator [Serratia oryzae]VXD07177.1 Transcriptional regulator [Enterobacterales bacterium 8AC]
MADIKLLRLTDVMQKTGFKKSWIYLLVKQGGFPPAVKIGSRSVAWVESEVNAWIAERINKREETLK